MSNSGNICDGIVNFIKVSLVIHAVVKRAIETLRDEVLKLPALPSMNVIFCFYMLGGISNVILN